MTRGEAHRVFLALPELAEQPGSVELSIDEARIAANLAHPNIVHVRELGNERGIYYLLRSRAR